MFMSPIEIVLRLTAGLALFFFLVWDWAWRVYATGELADAIAAAVRTTLSTTDDQQVVRDHFQILSLFIGNVLPTEAVVNLLLAARGFFGLSLVTASVWRVIESLIVTSEKRYTVDLFLVLFGVASLLFCVALLLHSYNLGLFTGSGNLG